MAFVLGFEARDAKSFFFAKIPHRNGKRICPWCEGFDIETAPSDYITDNTIPTATMPKEVKQKSGIAVGINAGHVRCHTIDLAGPKLINYITNRKSHPASQNRESRA